MDQVELQASEGALQGLHVVEVTTRIAAAYCGKLLADLGAEVIKVEPPGVGDPVRRLGPFYHDDPSPDSGLLFNYLNTNKLGVTLNLRTTLGREWLARLLAQADVLIVGGELTEIEAQALWYETVRTVHPTLVGVYVTPFGLTGPYAHWKGEELTSFHLSALGILTPAELDGPTDQPPLKAGGRQALLVAGLTAAVATLHALFARAATGQGQRVDVSEWEPLASFQFMNLARWAYMGDPGTRRTREVTTRRIRCKDGAVAVLFAQDHQWQAWVEVMGNPGWAHNPEYRTRAGRSRHQQEIFARMEEWAAASTKEELYRAGQARRVPVFPENTVAEAVESAQVQSRGFLQELPLACGATVRAPGAPYQLSRTPVQLCRPAPRLGQHNIEVLGQRLGLSHAELAAAYEAGVV